MNNSIHEAAMLLKSLRLKKVSQSTFDEIIEIIGNFSNEEKPKACQKMREIIETSETEEEMIRRAKTEM